LFDGLSPVRCLVHLAGTLLGLLSVSFNLSVQMEISMNFAFTYLATVAVLEVLGTGKHRRDVWGEDWRYAPP